MLTAEWGGFTATMFIEHGNIWSDIWAGELTKTDIEKDLPTGWLIAEIEDVGDNTCRILFTFSRLPKPSEMEQVKVALNKHNKTPYVPWSVMP